MGRFKLRIGSLEQAFVLFCGFVATGLIACWLLFTVSANSVTEASRQELLSGAKLVSLTVNAEAQAAFNSKTSQNDPILKRETDNLRTALTKTIDIRYVYTLGKNEKGQICFLVDATPEGDLDKDGVEDKSNVFDVVTAVTPEMQEAFDTGIPTVEKSPTKDSWGTWQSAYAPIMTASGKLIVVGVDRDARVLEGRIAGLKSAFVWASIFISVFGFLAVVLLWIRIGKVPEESIFTKSQSLRSGVEIALLAMVTFVVIDGISATANLDGLRSSSEVKTRSLSAVSTASSSLTSKEGTKEGDIAVLLSRTPTPWLGYQYAEAVHSAELGDRSKIDGLAKTLNLQAMMLSKELATISDEQEKEGKRLSRTIIIAMIVAVLACILLRFFSRQGVALRMAVKKRQHVEADYKNLLDNAPVGLLTFRDTEIKYCNDEFLGMLQLNRKDPSISDVFAKVNPEDILKLQKALDLAQAEFIPFETTFRIYSRGSETRHIEMKGIPIKADNGSLVHILAFTLDITENLQAKLSYQTKSHEVEIKNKMLAAALEDLESNLESVVRCLVKAVEAKDPYTAGHSERVTQYSLWIGEELGLGPYELRVLELGTLVHDVGKIGIPDAILTKPGKLTDEEYEEIKKHPELGVRILEGIGMFQDCIPIVRWHHERLDGSGYPDKLEGSNVPFLVRIAAVADIFDAMTSTRAYRSGIEPAIVLKVLREDANKGLLDPIAVEALEKIIAERGLITEKDAA